MNPIKHRLVTTLAALAAGASAVILMPAPLAQADVTAVIDTPDTPESPADILWVKLRHGHDQIRVKAVFDDLRKRDGDGRSASVFFDTRRKRSGPEYTLGTGLGHGSDYILGKTRTWKLTGSPLSCDYEMRLNYKHNVMRIRLARSCFDNPGKVRLAMVMRDHSDGSKVVDWVSGRREFTVWVRTGRPTE